MNNGATVNSNNLHDRHKPRKTGHRPITSRELSGKNQRGGAPRQRGLGQEGIPAEIHNNGDPDENQESYHRPRPGGGRDQGTVEGGCIFICPMWDNNLHALRRGEALPKESIKSQSARMTHSSNANLASRAESRETTKSQWPSKTKPSVKIPSEHLPS